MLTVGLYTCILYLTMQCRSATRKMGDDMTMTEQENSRIETEWAYFAQNGDTRDQCWLSRSCLVVDTQHEDWVKTQITTDLDAWTESIKNPRWLYFRIDQDRNLLYRKEIDSTWHSGCSISYVTLGTLLADNWLNFEF